jgi:hypothetical protein
MTLRERRVLANSVRVPAVDEGSAILVGRYEHAKPKAVILHPRDYSVLRDAALIVGALERQTAFSDAALAARDAEDRPQDDLLVEDGAEITELLGL